MRIRMRLIIAFALCVAGFLGWSLSGPIKQNRLNSQLLAAIRSRQGDHAVRALIQEGANPNAVGNNEYDTALFQAIELGSVSTAQVLLANGASVHAVGEAQESPAIMLACYQPLNAADYPLLSVNDNLALFKDFRRHGESIEEQDSLGDTPLMRAVWSGNVEATEALLRLGANSHVVNNQHQTIWYWTEKYPDKQDRLRNLLSRYKAYSGTGESATP